MLADIFIMLLCGAAALNAHRQASYWLSRGLPYYLRARHWFLVAGLFILLGVVLVVARHSVSAYQATLGGFGGWSE